MNTATPVLPVLVLLLAACNQNTALGNDREAQLDPASTPAPIEPPEAALANVSGTLMKPETMSDADVAALGGRRSKCAVTLTEVSFPAFLYQPGGTGYLKMNGKLIPLPAQGGGRFAAGGMLVALQPLDDRGNAGLQAINMVVVLPDAKDELGYRGYVRCFEGAAA